LTVIVFRQALCG